MSAQKNTLIIGGGIAGTIAASYLARAGRKTLLLEQNHHTGGNMSGFRRGPWYFDGGDQSFESLGVVFPILEDLGVYDKFEWTKVRYRFMSPDFDFFVDSFDAVESALRAAFPAETGIPELFRDVKEVSAFLEKHCGARSFPLLNDFSVGKLLPFLPDLPKLLKWTTYAYRERVCALIKDPSLRSWFTGIGYYRMPYLFFAGFWNIWMRDYWYPSGGMQKLHDVLSDNYRALGGELRCNALAKRIETRGGKATGVVLSTGEFIEADAVVYAGDYKALVSGLLDEGVFPARKAAALREAKLTESLVAAYLGVDIPPAELGARLQSHHTFWFPNYDVTFPDATSGIDVHRNMWVTSNFFMDHNPSCAPEGKSTLVLQTYSAADWQGYWRNGSMDGKRTAEYKALKEKVGRELVALAENFVPGLSSKIDYFEVGTPLSIKRFSLNDGGSSGGWCYDDAASPAWKAPLKNLMKTPVPNLWAAGHYALWPGGVISAALSGRFAANLALGKPMLTPMGK